MVDHVSHVLNVRWSVIAAMEVSDDDYRVFASHEMIDIDDKITFSHHLGPDMKRLSGYPPTKLPDFLFRTYSDQSMGVNSPETFQCQYYKVHSTEEQFRFADIPYTRIKVYLQDHTNNKKTLSSLFVSFSASLLATLQRAEWLKANGHKNVYVAVLDTWRLQKDQLILPLSVLQSAFGIVENRKYVSLDCMDEFLVWGRLTTCTHHVSHERLVLSGLHRLLPELNDDVANRQLGAQLARLRNILFDQTALATATQLEPALTISWAWRLARVLSTPHCAIVILFLCVLSLRDHRTNTGRVEECAKNKILTRMRKAFLANEKEVNLDAALWRDFSWRKASSDKPEIVLHQHFCCVVLSFLETSQLSFAQQAKSSLLGKHVSSCVHILSLTSHRKVYHGIH